MFDFSSLSLQLHLSFFSCLSSCFLTRVCFSFLYVTITTPLYGNNYSESSRHLPWPYFGSKFGWQGFNTVCNWSLYGPMRRGEVAVAYVCGEGQLDFASFGLCESTRNLTTTKKRTLNEILGAKGPDHFIALSQPSGHGWQDPPSAYQECDGHARLGSFGGAGRKDRLKLSMMGQGTFFVCGNRNVEGAFHNATIGTPRWTRHRRLFGWRSLSIRSQLDCGKDY